MNIINKPVNFLKEVKTELSKVAWSTRQELLGATAVVISATALMVLFIGAIDFGLSRFLSALFK